MSKKGQCQEQRTTLSLFLHMQNKGGFFEAGKALIMLCNACITQSGEDPRSGMEWFGCSSDLEKFSTIL